MSTDCVLLLAWLVQCTLLQRCMSLIASVYVSPRISYCEKYDVASYESKYFLRSCSKRLIMHYHRLAVHKSRQFSSIFIFWILLAKFCIYLSDTYCCLSQKHQWSKSVKMSVYTGNCKILLRKRKTEKKLEIISLTLTAKDRKKFRQLYLWSSPKKCSLIPKGK